ncbi:carboxymuconolactone decarboxylase family protein [Streptomyces sp. NBC_01335]|uniref:carboxymuconolactone decarboxylase family protein n=1 Tax=Streptomyces sp. NBC_01335 TaxID=2903828 RepID=UPI002E0E8CDC
MSTRSTTEPATDPATAPAIDPATGPATDPAGAPVTGPATGPEAEEDGGVQSRLPDLTRLFPELPKLSGALRNALRNAPVPQAAINLSMLRGAQIVGSTYHAVSLTGVLRKAGETETRITAVATWQDAPFFTDSERVALKLTEAVLTPNPFGERVSDELFAEVAALYDEEAIWALALAIGQLSLFVPIALIGKPIPGRPVGKNYSR